MPEIVGNNRVSRKEKMKMKMSERDPMKDEEVKGK